MSVPTIVCYTACDPETLRPSIALRCHTCHDKGTTWAYTALQHGQEGDKHAIDLAVDHMVLAHNMDLHEAELLVWKAVTAA